MHRHIDLDVVSHSWNYGRLLAYQISSLFLYPSQYNVRLTIVCCPEDTRTLATIGFFVADERIPENLTIRPWLLKKENLMRRAIGRNAVALTEDADVLWYADCDYLFREGTTKDGQVFGNCIDALMETDLSDEQIVYPRWIQKTESMEAGDELMKEMDVLDVRDVPEEKFCWSKLTRAVGGAQIVKGSTARRYGYLPDNAKHQQPSDVWLKTRCDVAYRREIAAGRGTGIQLPGVYRIRHSEYGRENPGVQN